jgi:hypothetical protein
MDKTETKMKDFQPLNIIGVFWLFFGVLVLFSTFFIKETSYIPLDIAILTNVLVGLTLFTLGFISLYRARKKKP